MAITAADVKKLRDATGAGMMDAKKALTEANGDFEAATEILRVTGAAKVSSRADREASNGLVAAAGTTLVQLGAETDFVVTAQLGNERRRQLRCRGANGDQRCADDELVDAVVDHFFQQDVDAVLGMAAIAEAADVHPGAQAYVSERIESLDRLLVVDDLCICHRCNGLSRKSRARVKTRTRTGKRR